MSDNDLLYDFQKDMMSRMVGDWDNLEGNLADIEAINKAISEVIKPGSVGCMYVTDSMLESVKQNIPGVIVEIHKDDKK